ncbi:MAG: AlwI family type II restriction endonuclease [Candidatus Omnitrophica bacterium]|nr:AlwI family type II restriction endonuclease [Candidatus Omnitrophota bacterium]
MAKLTRTKEIWHIPKRGSVHQTIYMVYVLSWDKFLGKSWSSGKQESLGSEMGKAGLTESGKAITHQSVRTLLANLPKYLGFVYIDESSSPQRIMVTDIGYELIRKHKIEQVPKHKNIKEYSEAGDLIDISEVFAKQMSKLIITNPSIKKDCENILVFPFRMTLKLLLELDFLDKEEIGYILFHTKTEDELPLLRERIKNFRALPPEKRTAEIRAYEKTDEGKLTLVKAPTAGYYMYLCYSTGLCDRDFVNVNKTKDTKLPAIKLKNKEEVRQLLKKFEDIEIYDFKDDWFLWKEYFSDPKRLFPPFDIVFKANVASELLLTIYKDDYIVKGDVISERKTSFVAPVFDDEVYKIIAYDLEKGNEIYNREIKFTRADKQFLLDLKAIEHTPGLNKQDIVVKIKEMLSDKYAGFDEEYSKKLKVIEKVLGKNYFDNRRKGGRLEYLFYRLLNSLKENHIIDEVFWYGHEGKYGIDEPAPGGKEGNPDIVFEIDSYLFVLELTTFRGTRAQWSCAEASSVPDHIAKFKRGNHNKKVIGIFSAPSIHHQLEQNLKLNARKENVGMIFKSCIEFSELLSKTNKKELLAKLVQESEAQIKS